MFPTSCKQDTLYLRLEAILIHALLLLLLLLFCNWLWAVELARKQI
jgi:hypothetical protein